jgi:hypothetical protein
LAQPLVEGEWLTEVAATFRKEKQPLERLTGGWGSSVRLDVIREEKSYLLSRYLSLLTLRLLFKFHFLINKKYFKRKNISTIATKI